MNPDARERASGEPHPAGSERDLPHPAGAIQPHGVLLLVDETDFTVVQCSSNAAVLLDWPPEALLGSAVGDVLPSLEEALHGSDDLPPGGMPVPRRLRRGRDPDLLALLHRPESGGVAVELEHLDGAGRGDLPRRLPALLEELSQASTLAELSDALTVGFRELAGYDRVMIYRFDPEGHGEILSEARRSDLQPYRGLRYPASDVPEGVRELYLRNRVHLLVDVDRRPAAVVPEVSAVTERPLDTSQCILRSLPPRERDYLRSMGVTATLVASIVHRGELWGLIVCHHYAPRWVSYDVRATADVLAETMSTRIAVLDSYKRAEAEVQVRHLEQALAEAVTSTGDWRSVLFAEPGRLLRPVGAQGAALIHDGDILTAGATPRRVEIVRVAEWLQQNVDTEFFRTSALAEVAPSLESLVTDAAGVAAFRLSRWKGEYLFWFRKERPENVRWAGFPREADAPGGDDHDLSPRRSFAVWNELVRGTSEPWLEEHLAAAEAIGLSLRDITAQTRAMSFLLAQRQLADSRENVRYSEIPLVLADSAARLLLVSQAFEDLFAGLPPRLERMEDLAELFQNPEGMRDRLPRPGSASGWRGRATLQTASGPMPVALRIDPIPLPGDRILGFVLLVNDLTAQVEVAASRTRVRDAIGDIRRRGSRGGRRGDTPAYQQLLGSILANASMAAMEIGDPHLLPPNAEQTLQEVEEATRRAARISRLIVDFSPPGNPEEG